MDISSRALSVRSLDEERSSVGGDFVSCVWQHGRKSLGLFLSGFFRVD